MGDRMWGVGVLDVRQHGVRLRQDRGVQANLSRIPDDDASAEKTLGRVGVLVDKRFLSSLDKDTRVALGRYGARSPSLALRQQNPDVLKAGLFAGAIAAVASRSDFRDLMVGYVLHFDAAQRLGLAPAELFDAVAARIADPGVATLLRDFGHRDDVTLDAFGWKLVDETDGLDYEPT